MSEHPSPSVLIVGATSAIAQEAARCFARDGARLALTGRDADRLDTLAADLTARGAALTESIVFDATDLDRHAAMLDAVTDALGGRLDHVLVAYGTLPDQDEAVQNPEAAVEAFEVNATSTIALLTEVARRMEAQSLYSARSGRRSDRRRGTLAVISSVAGDRGRPSNYVYGAAKGAVSLFAQGLRSRLASKDVRVVTVKPGLVDTPMTAHLDKSPLYADPADVGARIHKAMRKGESVVYTPGFWRPVMAVIRAIPERLFKRLDF